MKIINKKRLGLKFSQWFKNLNEDAFSRTDVGGMYHRIHIAHSHRSKRARSARVVHWSPGARNVGNAILKLDEHVGADIDAQTIACTEILVNPHVHTETVPLQRP